MTKMECNTYLVILTEVSSYFFILGIIILKVEKKKL